MVSEISSQQAQGVSHFSKPDPSKMFGDLASKVGAGESGITKEDLENYLKKLQEEGKGDSKEAKMIGKLTEDFDKLSGGTDTITASSMQKGMEAMRPHGGNPPKDMFSDLSEKVGADGNGITKENLEAYLKKLQEEGSSDSKETDLISKLIKDFDKISGGESTITAESLQNDFQNRFASGSRNEWQDPSTITSSQLEPPIDIRV